MRAPGTAILRVANLRKSYAAAGGATVALNGVNLNVAAGSFVSIIGASGCGKSTLLQIMAGLVTPTSGDVLFETRRVQGPPPDLIYVFQQYTRSLFPWKTVERNVAFGLENKGTMARDEIAARTHEMIRLVKLTGFERHYPWQLSGGMQQRVAIARALMLSPSLMLMDEPFGALDALTREEMNLELQRISLESGQTILFVTHSIPEAAFLSDRVLVMSGRPSTVVEIVSIDNPRPRAIDMLVSDRFGRYVSHMRNLLGRTEAPL
jgi:NitT/TauT family transport system ATP-binding protein